MTSHLIETELPCAPSRESPSRSTAVVLGLILIIAAFLRLYRISERSFWYDESFTVHIAGDHWSKIIGDIVFYENTPPLHYLLLKPWAGIVGISEWSMRFPSAVFGVISVWLLYRFASYTVGRREGLIAAALLAVSQYHIYYSQEARAYALMFMLGLWSCDEFIRLLNEPIRSTRREARYCIATILSLYSHIYGIVPLAIQWVWYGWRNFRGPSTTFSPGRFLKTQLAIGLAFAPWVPILIYQYRVRAHHFWIQPMSGIEIPASYWAYTAWGSELTLCICSALAVIGAARLTRSRFTLLTLLLLPVVAPVIASMLTHPLFIPRYGMIAMAGMFILAAAGITALPSVLNWALVLVLAMALNRAPIPERIQSFREIGEYLDVAMQSGDLLIVDNHENLFACKYYVHRTDVTIKGLRTGNIPIGLPLPEGMRNVWLVLISPQFEPDEHSLLAEGNWRVDSIKRIKSVPIFKLSQDDPSAAEKKPTTSPG